MDAIEPMVKVVGAKCLECGYQCVGIWDWFQFNVFPAIVPSGPLRDASSGGHSSGPDSREKVCYGQIQIEMGPA